jgi:hypothetical protein
MVKNINFGYIKYALVKSSTSLYLNESKLNNDLKDFLKTIKSSPVLTLEYIVYKNLENKHITDDVLATRYIDENLSLVKDFTKNKIIEENSKLEKYLNESIDISNNKKDLYDAISIIILENASDNKYKNVDKIHSSFEIVLNHIKNNKSNLIEENKTIFEEYKDKLLNYDFIFNSAIKKFNEKYSHLSDGEKRILKVLIKEDIKEKENIFTSMINETTSKLNQMLKIEEVSETANKLQKTKEKIQKMVFNESTLIDDIVKLNTLKESL